MADDVPHRVGDREPVAARRRRRAARARRSPTGGGAARTRRTGCRRSRRGRAGRSPPTLSAAAAGSRAATSSPIVGQAERRELDPGRPRPERRRPAARAAGGSGRSPRAGSSRAAAARMPVAVPHEVAQQLDRRRRGPLQVLEHEHDRLLDGEAVDQLHDRLEQLEAGAGAGVVEAAPPAGREQRPERPGARLRRPLRARRHPPARRRRPTANGW